MSQIGRYSKFLVAVIGLASVVITTYYGSAAWAPAALSALSAAGVLLVPNQPAPVTVLAPQPSNVKPVPPVPPAG